MQPAVVTTPLDRRVRAEIADLVAAETHARGYRPVSDQFWLDLHDDAAPPLVSIRSAAGGELQAYVQGVSTGSEWHFESISRDEDPGATAALAAAVDAALLDVASAGGSDVAWLVQGPSAAHHRIARERSLVVARQLHEMRRPLPTGIPVSLETRPFDAARDLSEWVRVNGRAFAADPDQGGWTEHAVTQRMTEAWFDPSGFLIHERDRRMAGFCWTKVHAETEPRLGEIYVIAVDPDFAGLGLGRRLTLAGLDSLAARGLDTAMLFVDEDNAAARHLYATLGFAVWRTDVVFKGHVA